MQSWCPQDNQFIYDKLMSQCAQISCHKHGCCLMQKGIDAASEQQKELLMCTVASHTKTFVRDPFANYVIQYILALK